MAKHITRASTLVEVVSEMPHNSFLKMKDLLTFKAFVIFALLSSCSSKGDIEYQPVGKTLTSKQLDQNVTLALLDFPDKRAPVKGIFYSKKRSYKPEKNLVGILFGGYNIRIRKLYSNRTISLDVTGAIRNLFKANGFNVIRYYGNSDCSPLSNERLTAKGQINAFFMDGYPGGRGTPPKIWVMIDIDLTIMDTKCQRTIWAGKIESYRKIGPNKGIFTSTNKIFLFLNTAFSDAIEKAVIDHGMLNALRSLDKKPSSK